MIEGATVLIVDDSQEIVNIISDFLTLNGCNVYKAATGRQALEIIKRNNIEIVLLDVKLSDVNGIALLDKIKAENSAIGVIIVTGVYDPSSVVEAMKKGAADFLMKPFDFDKLMLSLIRALKEREVLIAKEQIFQRLEDKKKIAYLNRELQKKIEELTVMYHITSHFNSINIFDDVYERTTRFIEEVFHVRSSGYYLYDRKANELVLYKGSSTNGLKDFKERCFLPEGFRKDAPFMKNLFYDSDRLYFPILIKGECIGFIVIEKNEGFQDKNIFFFRVIAERVSTLIENKMLYESLFENIFQTLTSLIEAIDKRDSYTASHCQRVNRMSLRLVEELGLSEYERDVIRIVAPVHDLGKLGIPDAILSKPGRLTEEERRIMQNHSIYGEEIMSRFEVLSDEAKVIRGHHERYDGNGYPDRASEIEIPLCSRIIAVADAYDAMVTDRPYRRAFKKEEALEEIKRCKNTYFDPEIADTFIIMMENADG